MSDALREARSAQAAAAGDFDPLRIRPYVELDGSGEPVPPAQAPAEPDATVPLHTVGSATPPAQAEQTSALPSPLAPPAGAPSPSDLRLFDAAGPEPEPVSGPVPPRADERPRRRRRGVVPSVAGAAVAVVAAAGYASGLFSYESPSRDGALPQEVRAGVPEPSADAVSVAPAPSSTVPSTPPTSASPSPSASASPSASPSPSPSSASPSPSRSASPTATPTTARPTETAGQWQEDDDHDDHDDHDEGGSALRRGDRGPQVADLQGRLRQLHLYMGDINGNFNHQVEDAVRTFQWARGVRSDELGVYGPETRQRLEAETSGWR
ncbi:peptidoglycan-binding protein [Streptomyces sp. NPDC006134]|uniref:peptidoglycan-binding domain-containing protein n=1 Tax=Streptomyces sp. NPDC006134 TaxID=3154467 RepID=UPI0033D5BF57